LASASQLPGIAAHEKIVAEEERCLDSVGDRYQLQGSLSITPLSRKNVTEEKMLIVRLLSARIDGSGELCSPAAPFGARPVEDDRHQAAVPPSNKYEDDLYHPNVLGVVSRNMIVIMPPSQCA
jgi:hypothetical protein